jgi:hypothetical protein
MRVDAGPISQHPVSRSEYASPGILINCITLNIDTVVGGVIRLKRIILTICLTMHIGTCGMGDLGLRLDEHNARQDPIEHGDGGSQAQSDDGSSIRTYWKR